jgi:diguanylate cyclase (GGDEF)-like protein
MAYAPMIPQAVNPGEIVSLTDRLARLQLLRVAFVWVSVAGAVLAFHVSYSVQEHLWMVGGAYLLAVCAAELIHRRNRQSSLAALATMLLVDGVYLAWVTYITGGTQSPLRFLVYLHLVAVSLLASYRTGLKIALWDSLLSLVVLYAQAASLIPNHESAPGLVPRAGTGLAALPVFNLTAFWLVAIVTAAFSGLNERELRRRRADSEALATMATEMEELHRPTEIAEKLLQWLGDGFGFGRAVVLGGGERVSVLAERGAERLVSPPEAVDSIVREVWTRRSPVLAKSIDGQQDPVLGALLPRARRVLVLPMFAEGQVLGAVAIEHDAGRGWQLERRIVTVAAQFVAYASLALRNAWLLDRLQQQASTDGLTGVANRRMFDITLSRELERARREDGSLSLLLLDVDRFKAFNDEHGHMAGDEVLRGIASALTDETREFDLVARYGGEEFGVVLPGCPAEEALQLAERLRETARGVPAEAPITVSVGIATFPHDATDVEGLMRAADDGLYRSKGAGRDQVRRGRAVGNPTTVAA